jgi:L-ascorbate metabolism protein UlaG (beta-lactamase superfamily)
VLRWARTRTPAAWPRWVEHAARYVPAEPGPGETLVTFVNHATFLIQFAASPESPALNVLTDPVWADRASPVQWAGPHRVHAPGVPFDALPRIDLVLLSHNHYDHMDLATLRRLADRFPLFIVTPIGNRRHVAWHPADGVIELDWWSRWTALRGFDLSVTPAQHFSSRTPFDRNRSLWGSFVLRSAAQRIFFAGDSGYAPHFTRIAQRLGPFDLALIPIGAYEPRWFMRPAHMNPEEAVQAHLDLRSPLSVGMHFGCFQLTDEDIDEPVRALARALEEHGVEPRAFRVLAPGETLTLRTPHEDDEAARRR